jgi:hypothetical protein
VQMGCRRRMAAIGVPNLHDGLAGDAGWIPG